jgi:putative Mg2+ transporter-C (MgtC) family protein
MHWTAQLEIVGQVMLATVLGGMIGFEREWAGKPAGLRTHMLVTVSATLLVTLGNAIVSAFALPEFMQADPIRIIEAVIVGISFLGAGTIMQREEKGKVEGLTTAASVLATAAIGMAVALHLSLISVGVTLLILVINRALNYLEQWMQQHLNDSSFTAGQQKELHQ